MFITHSEVSKEYSRKNVEKIIAEEYSYEITKICEITQMEAL